MKHLKANVCFHRNVSKFSRNEASEKIELRGGKISSNISKKRLFNSRRGFRIKTSKAKNLNKVLNESEFMKLINN